MNNLRVVSKHVKNRFPGARIRRATHEDYKAVLELPTTDLDYLPDLYHSYIDNPRRRIYVCETDHEIVGLEMLCIVDDGKMVVSRAGRVKPSLQGLGIITSLLQHGLGDIKREFPIKTLAWTTSNAEQTQELLKWNNHIQCAEKGLLRINFTPVSLNSILQSDAFKRASEIYTTNTLHVLKPNEAYSIMTSIQNKNDLLPSGLWVVKYEVFSPKNCNYHIPIEELKSTIITTAQVGGRLRDISFGSFFRCSYGYRYQLDFYSDKTETPVSQTKLFTRHVLKHLVMIAQMCLSDNISVGIYFLKLQDIDGAKLNELLLNKLNWPEIDKEFTYSE